MGKLNSLIKFVVVNVNVLLFLGGLGTIGVASFVLQADFIMLAEVLYDKDSSNSMYIRASGTQQ